MKNRGFPGIEHTVRSLHRKDTDMDWVSSLVSAIGPIISNLVTHFLG